jgi:hypothetical protein
MFCAETDKVHTERQPPLSGVHPIMMEKLAHAGDGGGTPPPPFTIVTISYKVAVYAPADWAYTGTLSINIWYFVRKTMLDTMKVTRCR